MLVRDLNGNLNLVIELAHSRRPIMLAYPQAEGGGIRRSSFAFKETHTKIVHSEKSQ